MIRMIYYACVWNIEKLCQLLEVSSKWKGRESTCNIQSFINSSTSTCLQPLNKDTVEKAKILFLRREQDP